MATEQYEVEIKSLLGTAEAAEKLRNDLKRLDPNCACVSTYTQLNHYFEGGEPVKVVEALADRVSPENAEAMQRIALEGKKISVRTREMNGEARIVMKASIGDDSSENGVARLEVEAPVRDMSLEQLDQVVLDAGYSYQAKWSRTREEYSFKDTAVCLDKNAGYGYLAEFEKVVNGADETPAARAEIEELMTELSVSELPQDRLERMFSFYNEHWPEYYGTDKIFVIE